VETSSPVQVCFVSHTGLPSAIFIGTYEVYILYFMHAFNIRLWHRAWTFYSSISFVISINACKSSERMEVCTVSDKIVYPGLPLSHQFGVPHFLWLPLHFSVLGSYYITGTIAS
jgi:hypothetical protein